MSTASNVQYHKYVSVRNRWSETMVHGFSFDDRSQYLFSSFPAVGVPPQCCERSSQMCAFSSTRRLDQIHTLPAAKDTFSKKSYVPFYTNEQIPIRPLSRYQSVRRTPIMTNQKLQHCLPEAAHTSPAMRYHRSSSIVYSS